MRDDTAETLKRLRHAVAVLSDAAYVDLRSHSDLDQRDDLPRMHALIGTGRSQLDSRLRLIVKCAMDRRGRAQAEIARQAERVAYQDNTAFGMF